MLLPQHFKSNSCNILGVRFILNDTRSKMRQADKKCFIDRFECRFLSCIKLADRSLVDTFKLHCFQATYFTIFKIISGPRKAYKYAVCMPLPKGRQSIIL